MARPVKNIVDYFPHDSRASESSDTLAILEEQFGHEGYAFWFKLLERISVTENHVIDSRNPVKWSAMLARMHFKPERATAILNLLASLDAIDPILWQSGLIWCQKLVDRVADVYMRRKGGVVPTRPVLVNNNSLHVNQNAVSADENPQSKLKETKLNKTKIDVPSKKPYGEFQNILLTEDEYEKLKAQFNSSLPNKIETLSCYKHSTGKKYKNDYATLLVWARREGYGNGKRIDQKPAGESQGWQGRNAARLPTHYTRPEDLRRDEP